MFYLRCWMLIFVHFYLQNKLLCNNLIRSIIQSVDQVLCNNVHRGMSHLHLTNEEQMKQQTIGWKRPLVLNMHEQDTLWLNSSLNITHYSVYENKMNAKSYFE